LFVKHPYDTGDRVDIATHQLIVDHISLLYTVFKRIESGKTVQISNILLNSLWVENITRTKVMQEQVFIFAAFETPFKKIETLENEMGFFLKQNSRDFYDYLTLEVIGIAEMNKLELRIEIQHKSNFSNETLRATRQTKFMCALVDTLRRIPIYGPEGGDPILGSAERPTWSVSIPPTEAAAAKKNI
jgi:small-conductance mechanosensitive channel